MIKEKIKCNKTFIENILKSINSLAEIKQYNKQ